MHLQGKEKTKTLPPHKISQTGNEQALVNNQEKWGMTRERKIKGNADKGPDPWSRAHQVKVIAKDVEKTFKTQ